MKEASTFSYFIKYLSWVLDVVVIVLIILLGGIRLFGYTPYAVTSGSMIPQYNVGTIVYVQKVDPTKLQIGDDITFRMNESVATHRIHSIDQRKQTIRTYGINNKDSKGNNLIDAEPVSFSSVIGKVAFSLPYLGNVYLIVNTSSGKILLIVVLALLIIINTFDGFKKRRG